MTITDQAKNKLKGSVGENITVTVDAEDTVFGVTFKLGGEASQSLAEGSPINFSLDEHTELVMQFHFPDDSGPVGKYRVQITGSGGGDTFKKTVKQQALDFTTKIFTFEV